MGGAVSPCHVRTQREGSQPPASQKELLPKFNHADTLIWDFQLQNRRKQISVIETTSLSYFVMAAELTNTGGLVIFLMNNSPPLYSQDFVSVISIGPPCIRQGR